MTDEEKARESVLAWITTAKKPNWRSRRELCHVFHNEITCLYDSGRHATRVATPRGALR